jgi:hypothetical protein
VAGGNLLGAAGEFAARQRLQNQRRNQAVAKQGDFFGFCYPWDLSLGPKLMGKRTPGKTSAVWERSGGPEKRTERGRTTVRSKKRGPAQQVLAQLGKQEAVGNDPTEGL